MNLWQVNGNRLQGVSNGWLDNQARPEEWIAGGRSVLRLDLSTTGRQVITDFGGWIAYLCPDAEGNFLIVDLKRHGSP
jgi:hypothetical protein